MNTDTEFLKAAESEMAALEDWLESTLDEADCLRNGNVLTIELENGESVVINIQTPMHEIWCASRFGGYHFILTDDGRWRDKHTDRTLEAAVADALGRFGAEVGAVP